MCTQDLANADYSYIFNVIFTTEFYPVTCMRVCTQLPRHAMTLCSADNIPCLSGTSSFCSCTKWLSFVPIKDRTDFCQQCGKISSGTGASLHQLSAPQIRKLAERHLLVPVLWCPKTQPCKLAKLLFGTRLHHLKIVSSCNCALPC